MSTILRILKGVKNNNDLCWITKAHVKIKMNRLENVVTHHKLIEYLATILSK